MLGLARRNRRDRTGFALYGAAVAAARQERFYLPPPGGLGVPDSLDGRFDLVSLFVVLLIRRLRALPTSGPALAQSVFDAMFADMDQNLREMGVGDLSVGKRVRAMWEALHGRAVAYEAALDGGDAAGLENALSRNLWRGETAPADAAARLARYARAIDAALGSQDPRVGVVTFPPAADA